MSDVRYGSLPFREQIAFFRGKVNVPTAAWTDVWRDGHDTAFMVAGAYKAELLADFRTAVDKAINDGTTLEEFRKDFDRIVETHGWSYNGGRGWRTRVIYETNLRASYQAGRFAQLTDPELLAARPYWRYVHSDFVRNPRPEHLSWDGLVLRHDDPWWSAHFPPNGWGCKCRVFPESEASLKRRGLRIGTAPPTRYETRVVGSRGPRAQSVRVPEGIDPGWDYTPGRTVADQVRTQLARKAPMLPPAMGSALTQAVQSLPATPAAPGTLPSLSTVGDFLPEEIMQALRAVPDAAPQLAKFEAFLNAHPQKVLVIKSTEMGGGKAAAALRNQVGEFLGVPAASASMNYRILRPTLTNGFTAAGFEHVVVKAKRGDRADHTDPAALARAVEAAIGAHATEPAFSVSDQMSRSFGKHSQLTTLVHELGHQVHFWAGAPARPSGLPGLTKYSAKNVYEWHAEHFAAWLFNRTALARWSPEVAQYIDTVVESAITSQRKRR